MNRDPTSAVAPSPPLRQTIGDALEKCRQNNRLYRLLWFLIALGLVPAIVTESIVPFDIFGQQFGIEPGRLQPPVTLVVAVLMIGSLLCLLQRRYWHLLLLLPGFALLWFDLDDLSFRLPIYSQVQQQLRDNQDLARDNAADITTDMVRGSLSLVEYPRDQWLPFDRAAIDAELDEIDTRLVQVGEKQQREIKRLTDQLSKKNREIRKLSNAAKRLQREIRKFEKNPLFIAAAAKVYKRLKTEQNAINKKLKRASAERSKLRARLKSVTRSQAGASEIYEQLFSLHAEVNTHRWISDAYRTWLYSLPYKLLCLSILLFLLVRFSLGSWVFLFTLSASMLVSIAFVEAPLSFRIWLVIKFVIFALVVKALYLVVAENLPVIRRQSGRFLLETGARTLKYYLPFIVLIVLGLIASQQANRYIDTQLYALDVIDNSDPANNTRRYDIDIAVDTFFAQREMAIHRKLDGLDAAAKNNLNLFRERTLQIYDEEVKPTLPEFNDAFDLPKCEVFYHWLTRTGKCFEKEIKRPVNDGYSDSRDEQYDNLDESLTGYVEGGSAKGAEAVIFAKLEVSARINALRIETKNQLRNVYFFIDLYTWASGLLLIMIILKSFLYIFSRIFYASEQFDHDRIIQFAQAEEPSQQGSVREVSDTLELNEQLGDTFYVNKAFDFANAPPDETTPQAGKAFFSRLKNRVWHMNRIETGPVEGTADRPYRRIPDNERIIVWTLKPGDEVIFSWKTFVGINQAIKIRTRYSWQ